MRTLKKVLALTLALATLFSLTAFAAYKDESKIDPDVMSAVNLVSSLKIMMGDENGFRPTDTIKRSEAAKMVYVLRTGGKTEADGWKGQNLFTDMKGHWAEGYVNYCASVGIIAGVGNKKFNPNGNVTGVELAKMLLVAAGYKADLQGYAGTQWANKVLADAESVGMFDGYDAAYMAAAPRQYAAQMFANALLRTNMAVYLSGELVTGIVANPVLVGTKYFGLLTVSGELTTAGKSFVLNPVLTLPAGVTLKEFNAPADLLYQDVRLVVNGKTGEVYDMYASGKSKVFNVKGSEIKLTEKVAKGASATEEYTLELPGYEKTTYKATANNTDIAIVFDKTSGTAAVDTMPTIEAAIANNNDTFRFIDTDGDGTFNRVMMFDGAYGKVSKNSTTDGFVTRNVADNGDVVNVSKDNYSKVNFVDSVVKGDLAYSYKDMAGTVCVKKVEPVKGVFTAKNAANDVFTVGGVDYKMAANAYDSSKPATLGKEYSIFTDGKYIVFATGATTDVTANYGTDFCLVIDVQNASGTGSFAAPGKVDVLLATGERKVMEYTDNDSATYVPDDEIGGKDTNGSPESLEIASVKGTVMQCVIKDGKISFKKTISTPVSEGYSFNTSTTPAAVEFAKNTKVFKIDTAYYNTTADTYVFLKHDTSKYSVVKASELNNLASVSNGAKFYAYSTKTNGSANTLALAYIDLDTASIPGSTTDKTYAFVTGGKKEIYDENATNKIAYQLDVMYLDGTKASLKVAESQKDFALGLCTVVTNEKGISTLAATVDGNGFKKNATMTSFGSNFIVAGNAYYAMAEGAKTYYVSANAEGDYAAGELISDEGEKMIANQTVSFVLDKDNKITTLVVSFDIP